MTKNVIWKKDVQGNSIHVYEYWKKKKSSCAIIEAEVSIKEPTLLSENLLFEQ